MKSRTLIALAVAGTCAWSASAFAGGTHSAQMNTGMSVEVQTPSSVNEAAPWLIGEAHLGGWISPQSSSIAYSGSHDADSGSDLGIGASASMSGSGSVSSEPLASGATTEYWLIGSESAESNVGSSASEGASGSVSFDSSMSASGDYAPGFQQYETVIFTSNAGDIIDSRGQDSVLVTEHYLVSGPLSSFDASDALVLAIAPTEQDIALLDALKEDFFIVTPSYG